ncbi:hypothetical protein Y1Q_0000475 [Alligator mississippiensis]|uniref:Uncharacterized protein n=1 Tax=Alligator mississippiensis TaxID=8496 RepID=A0A151MBA5_ALLMI|nr:hypothetical protein Y1Q_0000475 [Alligator mississippiensis]
MSSKFLFVKVPKVSIVVKGEEILFLETRRKALELAKRQLEKVEKVENGVADSTGGSKSGNSGSPETGCPNEARSTER